MKTSRVLPLLLAFCAVALLGPAGPALGEATITIINSEVDSPSTWERPRKTVSAGTNNTPPPTPTRPPASPPATAIKTASASFI